MSSPEAKPIEIGKIAGTIYTFASIGDEIEMHVHGEHDKHTVICARGSVLVYGPGIRFELKAGGMIWIAAGQEHAIEALEPDSRIFNLLY